jgi:2-polyprenyl-3-methyl-5-hydroxy-6-metoxy-1,4-benzoquinol methylase
MLYSSNNTAKQWILEQLSNRFGDREVNILDLACGTGWIWEPFLMKHPNVKIVGIDFDIQAIESGKMHYQQSSRIELRIGDAQKPIEAESYDVVVALSAIEHVVNRKAFLETVYRALKPGGVAYLNYDIGHFRSTNIKERIMVPISQILAAFGFEQWYMKPVDDAAFQRSAEAIGFTRLDLRKHNIIVLKDMLKGASAEAIETWYAFEERLGTMMKPEKLDEAMFSTTIVLQKP